MNKNWWLIAQPKIKMKRNKLSKMFSNIISENQVENSSTKQNTLKIDTCIIATQTQKPFRNNGTFLHQSVAIATIMPKSINIYKFVLN